ncbi:MAG: hypothetical protein ACQRW7_05185 [Caulobacterales bacterium]|uniref:hypothetical protein n=1 Tax=Glycocaulis sp. TaxID=1969725 RepID=UPI003F9F748D
MRAFSIFVVSTILALGALGYGAHLLGVPVQWIIIGVVLIGGIALASGAGLARRRNQTNVAVSSDDKGGG